MKKIIAIILLSVLFCGIVEAKKTPQQKAEAKAQRKANRQEWWANNKGEVGNFVGSVVLGITSNAYEAQTGDSQTANQMRQVGIDYGLSANVVNHSSNLTSSAPKNEKIASAVALTSDFIDKASDEFSDVAILNVELHDLNLDYIQKINKATTEEEKAILKAEWSDKQKDLSNEIRDTWTSLKAEKDEECAQEMEEARSDEERAAIFRRCKNCKPCHDAEVESKKRQAKEEQEEGVFDEEFAITDNGDIKEVDKTIVANSSEYNHTNNSINSQKNAKIQRQQAIEKLETAKIEVYAFDEVILTAKQKSELNEIAKTLATYTDLNVCIIGHTCNIGAKHVNYRKGLKRAEAGKEYLIEKGINENRIIVDSKGDSEPLMPNTSNSNRQQNRRITFTVK
jgi:outer membrane protein OmpA-like peptidoglycan-associated protein